MVSPHALAEPLRRRRLELARAAVVAVARLEVIGLSAHGNWELLFEQAERHRPRWITVTDPDVRSQVDGTRLGGACRLLDGPDGITTMVTYPDVVSGGFSVLRNDGGVWRAHFGLVLNNNDPRACTSGYVSTGQTPSPGAVASVDTSGIQCQVVNGVDPNPGDGIDESGSDIRGSQNIGGSGGVGSPGPTGGLTGGANPLSPPTDTVSQLLGGLLSATPIARSIG